MGWIVLFALIGLFIIDVHLNSSITKQTEELKMYMRDEYKNSMNDKL